MHFTTESILGLLAFLGLGAVLAVALLAAHTAYVLTHPPRRTYASALARGRPGDPGELLRPDGGRRSFTTWEHRWGGLRLPGWDIVGDDPAGPVFVFSHGWGDSRIGGLVRAQALASLASRLILWDMPGHGEAPGVCALGTREVGALRALIETIGSGQKVVLYGWSLGAGVSIAAALSPSDARHPALPAAVIAEAPYCLPDTPARNVLRAWGLPWRVNLPIALTLLGMRFGVGARWRGFDRAALAAGLTVPLLVLHGERDEISPPEDGERIARGASRGTFAAIPGGGHHGLWTDEALAARCRDAVRDFLFRALNSDHAHQPDR